MLQAQQLICSCQLLSTKTRILAPLRMTPSAVRLPLTHIWNLRMTTTRKPLVADQVTILRFLRSKPPLRQLPVYFKKWCDQRAGSVKKVSVLHRCQTEARSRRNPALRQPLCRFQNKAVRQAFGPYCRHPQWGTNDLHVSLWIPKKSQTTATAIL